MSKSTNLVFNGGSIPDGRNKIHRYSFGDGIVDGETPVYGSWLIDLDKPDPDGPEGYARVTPAEFWNTITTNEEVPVYLQDKNSDNSLTYAYLSRADVTKNGSTVTNVFMFFVRSGYGNNLDQSYGFKFTKLDGSDYIQKAVYDSSFTALSETGDSGTTKPTFTTAQAVANIASGEKLAVMLGKIAKWFSAGFPMKNYGTKTIVSPYINVDNNGYTKIVNPADSQENTVQVRIETVTDGEIPNIEIDIDNSAGIIALTVIMKILVRDVYVEIPGMVGGTLSVSAGKILHVSAHGMGCLGTILDT